MSTPNKPPLPTGKELDAEVEYQIKSELKDKVVRGMRTAYEGINKRKDWIAIREGQITELQMLKNELIRAYDLGDAARVDDNLGRIVECSQRGCKTQ